MVLQAAMLRRPREVQDYRKTSLMSGKSYKRTYSARARQRQGVAIPVPYVVVLKRFVVAGSL